MTAVAIINGKMNKKVRTYSQRSRQTLSLLGQQIKLARKTARMSQSELASRAGMARSTLQNIEKGDPLVEVGLVFEAATVAGVALFAPDNTRLAEHAARLDDKLALLPKSIQPSRTTHNDDF